MGILDIFRPKKKSIAEGAWSTGSAIELIRGASGWRSRRSVQETLAAYSTSPWFRAVIERAAYAAAIVPWRVFATRRAKPRRGFDRDITLQMGASPDIREKALAKLDAQGRLVEITDHKLLEMLADPNPMLTGVDVRLITFALLFVAGEAGWALERNGVGAPIAIWPVPPHWIVKVPTKGAMHYVVQMSGQRYDFTPEEFILFRNPSLVNPYGRGTGLGVSLADELSNDEYISKFQNTYFHSNGHPDLLVVVKPAPGGKGTTPETLAAAKEEFENKYRGSGQGRSMWTRGDITIQEISQKLVDLDLTEQRTWLKDLIRQVIGVPPEIMGDVENSNRATITGALAIMAIMSTVPQLEKFRAQLQQHLVPMYDPRLALGYLSPVPSDKEFELKAVQVAPWAATRGEIRKLQGFEDRGEPDNIHFAPMGLVPLDAPPLPRERVARTHMELLTKAVTPVDIDQIVNVLTPEYLDYAVTPEIEKTIEKWGNRTLAAVGVAPNFNMLNPMVTQYLDRFSSTKIVGITDTTIDLTRQSLIEGVRVGEGADELARRLRVKFTEYADYRAANIGRTETTGAANFATWGAHKTSGVVEKREWLATDDGRGVGRPVVHMVFDRLPPVGIDDPFVAGGYIAFYPGGFGDPAMDCQCRCTTAAVIEEPKAGTPEHAQWYADRTPRMLATIKTFVEETAKDERAIIAATQGVFAQQLEDVLAELRKVA